MFSINHIVLSRYLGASISLLALIVIFGWYSHTPLLVQIHPTFVAMQFNTALCFLLCGAGISARSLKYRKLSTFIASLVVLISTITFIQYIAHTNLNIDQLFLEHYITTSTTHPGRMAISTALCFMLSGITIVTHNIYPRFHINKIIGPAISGMGSVALIGYIFSIETAYGLGNLSAMAVHTAMGFVVIGIALTLMSAIATDKSLLFGQYWKESTLTVALIVFTFALSQAVENWQNKQLQEKLDAHTVNATQALKTLINTRVDALNRMAHRWHVFDSLTKQQWENDSLQYVNDFPDMQAIEWVNRNMRVKWVVPIEGNEKAIDFDLSSEDKRHATLLRAQQIKSTTISPAVELIQGKRGFLIVEPLTKQQENSGFLVGVIAYTELLNVLADNFHLDNFNLTIKAQHKIIAHHKPESESSNNYIATQQLAFFGVNWQITLKFTKAYASSLQSQLPSIILVSGMIAIFMSLLFLKLWRDAALHSQKLLHEITLHKNTKSLLAYEENRLRTTLQSMGDSVVLADHQGTILSINQATTALFGYREDEMIGKNVRMLMPEPDRSQHDDYIANYLHSKTPKIIGIGREVVAKKKNQKSFPIHLSIAHMTIDNEQFFSAIIRDISQQKTTELALAKYTKELERSNKELSEFAYIASHDLKAPLRGIMQLSNWIDEELQDNKNSQITEYIRLMQSRTSRLEKLLDDLLSYATLTEKVEKFTTINVDVLVKDTFQLLNPPASIHLEINSEIVSFNTIAVPLEQVLRNLINNAIKHHDKETGHITVSIKPIEHGYQFSVCDDGPGIDPQYHQQIFGIFKTLKPRDELEGSGMGLAIVKKILDTYDCDITIDSNGNTGTCFAFTWPDEATLKRLIDD
ncbi:PAS domain S-box protein [Thalassotalea sp. 1_MG-2023]|uniref:PAS domain S-box protein n=1 Tax=Thalassotalea sp. 1_MG-2023 TaxID=3062680 RepID=UPI0026E23020|nr:PAS domain S-box protein [Thalassotalea sp. 1_MG-2023]MDO6425899.1 PAS domain S-box protein [Thalassotalea sp. 1_MG-2023]